MTKRATTRGGGEELFVEVDSKPTQVGRQENIFRIFRLVKDATGRWAGLPLSPITNKDIAPTERRLLGISAKLPAKLIVTIFESAEANGQKLQAGQASALKPGSEASVEYRMIVLTEDGRIADALCRVDRLRSARGWHDIRRKLVTQYRFWTRREVPDDVLALETIVDALAKAVNATPAPVLTPKK